MAAAAASDDKELPAHLPHAIQDDRAVAGLELICVRRRGIRFARMQIPRSLPLLVMTTDYQPIWRIRFKMIAGCRHVALFWLTWNSTHKFFRLAGAPAPTLVTDRV
jgi:hypothetical protein